MTYDPNDPKRTDPVDRDPTVRNDTYVAPVERRASPLPLIIGVLVALALAYFVLQRFMTDDEVVVEGNDTTVTTEAPADETADADVVTTTDPVADEVVVEEPATEAEAETEAAVDNAGDAIGSAADATADTASDAADAVGEAANDAADATSDALTTDTTEPAVTDTTEPAAEEPAAVPAN